MSNELFTIAHLLFLRTKKVHRSITIHFRTIIIRKGNSTYQWFSVSKEDNAFMIQYNLLEICPFACHHYHFILNVFRKIMVMHYLIKYK